MGVDVDEVEPLAQREGAEAHVRDHGGVDEPVEEDFLHAAARRPGCSLVERARRHVLHTGRGVLEDRADVDLLSAVAAGPHEEDAAHPARRATATYWNANSSGKSQGATAVRTKRVAKAPARPIRDWSSKRR